MNNEKIEEELTKVSSPYIISYDKAESDKAWNFSLQGRKIWNVSLDFFRFPDHLPHVKLLDQTDVGTLAHVNRKCTVCVEESDTVLIDINRFPEVIETFLSEIVEVLDYSSHKIAQDELADEYEGYFHCDNKGSVNSFYTATAKLEFTSLKIVLQKAGQSFKQNKPHYPILLLNNHNEYPKSFSNVNKVTSTIINIIHLPLEVSILPPPDAKKITSEYIYGISKNISEENKKVLDKLLQKTKTKKEFFILLSIPRRDFERTQLLLHFNSKYKLDHPLLKYSDKWEIEHYSIQRHNKEYLLERGGAQNSLSDKKVVIVGCGSVGSEIAFMLAKSGVGELTLIDKDTLEADNIYRHRLGGAYLNYVPNKTGKVNSYSKVSSLKDAIEKDLPHVEVKQVQTFFERVIDEDYIQYADLIIFAVGSPSLNLKFNEELKKRDTKNTIFCWNEAAGYGGHSVFLNPNESCLECLYTDEESYTIICKLDFLEAGQNISKNLTGCAGVFTPFSYLDSSQTALLATTQAVEFLLGQNSVSKAISWKGKGNGTLSTTERYNIVSLMEEVEINKEDHCRICNGG